MYYETDVSTQVWLCTKSEDKGCLVVIRVGEGYRKAIKNIGNMGKMFKTKAVDQKWETKEDANAHQKMHILHFSITAKYVSTLSNTAIELCLRTVTIQVSKPYENDATLTGQNPPFKRYKYLEIQNIVRKKVYLLMLKLLGL